VTVVDPEGSVGFAGFTGTADRAPAALIGKHSLVVLLRDAEPIQNLLFATFRCLARLSLLRPTPLSALRVQLIAVTAVRVRTGFAPTVSSEFTGTALSKQVEFLSSAALRTRLHSLKYAPGFDLVKVQ
jgi:hypothetical protein